MWEILFKDLYGFDETRSVIGIAARSNVVANTDRIGRATIVQPCNRERVTVIKCVNASSWCLPLFVIYSSKPIKPSSTRTPSVLQQFVVPNTHLVNRPNQQLVALKSHGQDRRVEFIRIFRKFIRALGSFSPPIRYLLKSLFSVNKTHVLLYNSP